MSEEKIIHNIDFATASIGPARDGNPMTVRKSTYTVPISRELAIEHGIIEPTPEERAELDRQRAESDHRTAERKIRMDAARIALAEITEEPARTILDLHHEHKYASGFTVCAGEDLDGYDPERPPWPCTTVITIAKHYGIDIPE